MTWTVQENLRDDRLQEIVDNLDEGATNPEPRLLIKTAGGTLLATFELDTPMGTVAAGVLTATGLPLSVTAAATGAAAVGELIDKDEVVRMSGVVGLAGGTGVDIVITDVDIEAGKTVELAGIAFTEPGA